MAKRGRPRKYNFEPKSEPESVSESEAVAESEAVEVEPGPEVGPVAGFDATAIVMDDSVVVPASEPVETWELTVCSTEYPHNVTEIVEGDESDCVARVEELFRRGMEVPLKGYTCFNGPASIAQIRYRKQ